ncbi:MAG: methyltransferase domain-containing protein [Candidatus Sumerlaeaceae bacterium]|nr:methyltransferase domain-containing protein [Candidatus Sumerlaeaceae bacterium]
MLSFIRQTLKDYYHVGAIAPSSRALARALAKSLEERPPAGAMHVLEVGPGTGALTRGILERLHAGDTLVLCEINPDFASQLAHKFSTDPEFTRWKNATEIICKPVEELATTRSFHHIVCGLPFNNFQPDTVRMIFAKFDALLQKDGTVNFFEYVAIRHLKRLVANRAERQRLESVEAILTKLIANHQFRQQLVLWNLPPAWARSLRFSENGTLMRSGA